MIWVTAYALAGLLVTLHAAHIDTFDDFDGSILDWLAVGIFTLSWPLVLATGLKAMWKGFRDG